MKGTRYSTTCAESALSNTRIFVELLPQLAASTSLCLPCSHRSKCRPPQLSLFSWNLGEYHRRHLIPNHQTLLVYCMGYFSPEPLSHCLPYPSPKTSCPPPPQVTWPGPAIHHSLVGLPVLMQERIMTHTQTWCVYLSVFV